MQTLKHWWPTVLLALVAVAAAAPGSDEAGTAPAGGEPWVVLAASGPVEARPADTAADVWQRVRRGDRLEPRTVLRTGKRGRATLARGSAVLILDPEAVLELPREAFAPEGVELYQHRGGVTYDVDRRKTRNFRVHTPFLVAGVKGTLFRVTVAEAFAAVTVDEGTVEVSSPGHSEAVEVRAGQSLRVDAGEGREVETYDLRAREERRREARDEARRFARAELRRLREAHARGRGQLEDPQAETDRLRGAGWEDELGNTVDELDEQQDELSEDLLHREAQRLDETAGSNP